MHKCILPWISLETTPLGGVRPCCLFKDELPNVDLKNTTLEQAFNSPAMNELREEFLAGKKPSGCKNCWNEEEAGKKSKRQYMLEKFKHVPFEPNLIFLDLKLGNICNLKCRICGSWSSSKWAQEQIAQFGDKHIATEWLKQGQWPRQSNKFWANLDKLLPNLKYFEFTGGEPFLIKQHFDLLARAVSRGHAGDIDIHYNTNGTQFPKQHEVWRHFKHVQIAFSIDNTGKRFEYERDGAKWLTVNRNIKKFLKLKEQGYPFSFQICVTWNVQNVWYMGDFLKWAKTSGINDIHFNLMHDPEEFSLTNLPKKFVPDLYLQLDKVQVQHPDYINQIKSIKTFISLGESSWNDGSALRKKLKETDTFRGISFASTHPEVAKRIGYE